MKNTYIFFVIHKTDLLGLSSKCWMIMSRSRVVKAHDQHGLGSKPTRAILLCPWERHFTALSPTW